MDEAAYRVEARVAQESWWFRGRRRLLSLLLSELLPPLPAGARVLDLGCGTGANESVLSGEGRFVLGLDASALPLRLHQGHRRGRGAVVCADALRLPLGGGTFDLVVALDVLEHLDDDLGAVRELARVCRPGGVIVIFVPALPVLWGPQDIVGGHRRRYQPRQLIELARAGGLEVRRQTFFNTLMFPPILLYRLAWRASGAVEAGNENELVGPKVNLLLDRLFALEVPLLRRGNLPVGVSLALIASPPRRPRKGGRSVVLEPLRWPR